MMNASSMDDEGLRNYPRVPNRLLLRRGNTVQMESISAHVFLNLYLDMTSVLYPREAHLNSPIDRHTHNQSEFLANNIDRHTYNQSEFLACK